MSRIDDPRPLAEPVLATTPTPGGPWEYVPPPSKKRRTAGGRPFEKGNPGGPGRPKDSTLTPQVLAARRLRQGQFAREAVGRFVDSQVPRFLALLERVEARDGPLAAWKCIESLLEFHIPKLARHELTGPSGGPQVMTIRWGGVEGALGPPIRVQDPTRLAPLLAEPVAADRP